MDPVTLGLAKRQTMEALDDIVARGGLLTLGTIQGGPGGGTLDGGAPGGQTIEDGVSYRIVWRHGTAAQWAANNTVLSVGEAGVEENTGRWKLGRGSVAWNDLKYQDTIIAAATTIDSPILTNPRISTVKGANTNTVLDLFDLADAVNYVRILNSITNGFLTFSAQGADANISFSFVPKGTGAVFISGARVKTIVETAVPQPNTTYTLGSGDERQIREHTNSSPVTVTVPSHTTWAAPIGSVSEHLQYGTGQVTFVPEAGVTINGKGGATKISAQHGTAFLRKRANNEWQLRGDITT